MASGCISSDERTTRTWHFLPMMYNSEARGKLICYFKHNVNYYLSVKRLSTRPVKAIFFWGPIIEEDTVCTEVKLVNHGNHWISRGVFSETDIFTKLSGNWVCVLVTEKYDLGELRIIEGELEWRG